VPPRANISDTVSQTAVASARSPAPALDGGGGLNEGPGGARKGWNGVDDGLGGLDDRGSLEGRGDIFVGDMMPVVKLDWRKEMTVRTLLRACRRLGPSETMKGR